MNFNQDFLDLSYEEVNKNINFLFENRQILLSEVDEYFAGFTSVIDKISFVIHSYVDDKSIEEKDAVLDELETLYLKGGLSLIPVTLLKSEAPETEKCCAALLLLVSNYLKIYPNNDIQEIVDSVYNLLKMKNNFKLVLVASDIIIEKLKMNTSTESNLSEFYAISSNFVDKILNKGENK